MSKLLVIPDVHGRDFWKKCKDYEGQIVFLGDYHDPYDFEFDPDGEYRSFFGDKIVRYNLKGANYIGESLANFEEILDFANDNTDRVTLLLGNHDWVYIHGGNASRKDFENSEYIKSLFKVNEKLFKNYLFVDDVLFTHAGVSQNWIDFYVRDEITRENLYDVTKHAWKSASEYRGGMNKYSGPVWLDFHELNKYLRLWHKGPSAPLYQVFGHTMMPEKGTIKFVKNGACIDSREIFEIDTDNPKKSLKVWDGLYKE